VHQPALAQQQTIADQVIDEGGDGRVVVVDGEGADGTPVAGSAGYLPENICF